MPRGPESRRRPDDLVVLSGGELEQVVLVGVLDGADGGVPGHGRGRWGHGSHEAAGEEKAQGSAPHRGPFWAGKWPVPVNKQH